MLRVCLAAMFSLVLLSCEDKQDDKVFSAQSCLDHATTTTVDTCVAMISGITSNRAYIIRCAADFKRQGIDTTTIVQAIDNLDNAGSTDATLTLYTKFAFSAAGSSTAATLATNAVADCRATDSENLLLLALSAQTATTLQGIADALLGGGSSIGNIDPNTVSADDLKKVGAQVIAVYPTACGTNGAFENSKVCTDMSTAIDGADANNDGTISDAELEELGKQFIGKI